MILTAIALHIAQNQTLSPAVRMLVVWTPVAQITLAPPMDNVIYLQRRALMTINPKVNDPE